jgi:hypothetical protein
MTAISLGQAARRSRLIRTAITAAIKVGRANDSGGMMGPARIRQRLDVCNVTSRSQEFPGGFVDFLLGRGARHPR